MKEKCIDSSFVLTILNMKLFLKKKEIEKLNVKIQKKKIQSDKITPLKPGTRHFYHSISPSIKSWNGFTF